MNFCVSGHENPTGAVYCVTCGKDLSLEAPASGRQCTLGHPMLDHEVTCLNCGNLPAVEKTGAGVDKSGSNKSGIIAKLELSDMQADARASIRKLQAKLKINLKVTAMILAIAIAIPSGYFGYTAYTGPNYQGKTVEEVLKNREEQVAAVLEPVCSVGSASISSAENDITYTSDAITNDYRIALGSSLSYMSAGDVRETIKDEVERQLKSALGDEYLKLDNATAVISSGEESAIEYCQIGDALNGLRDKSNTLDATITQINSPGSWAPGYSYDSSDPNIAYKWAPDSAYPNGGWAVDVIARLGCPVGVTVTIDGIYGDYVGSSGALSPDERARVRVYTGLFYLSESGSIEEATC